MTQADFCIKYGVKAPYISTAVKRAKKEPVGKVQGVKKIQPDYLEKDLLDALLQEYRRRYDLAIAEAKIFVEKIEEAKKLYKISQKTKKKDENS